MAESPYTFTSTTVGSAGAVGTTFISGEALDALTFVYVDTTANSVVKKADNSDGSKSALKGITLNKAEAAGQPVCVLLSGEVTVQNACFASVGIVLAISATAGKCMPVGGLASPKYLALVGYTTATNKFMLDIVNAGVQVT